MNDFLCHSLLPELINSCVALPGDLDSRITSLPELLGTGSGSIACWVRTRRLMWQARAAWFCHCWHQLWLGRHHCPP